MNRFIRETWYSTSVTEFSGTMIVMKVWFGPHFFGCLLSVVLSFSGLNSADIAPATAIEVVCQPSIRSTIALGKVNTVLANVSGFCARSRSKYLKHGPAPTLDLC